MREDTLSVLAREAAALLEIHYMTEIAAEAFPELTRALKEVAESKEEVPDSVLSFLGKLQGAQA